MVLKIGKEMVMEELHFGNIESLLKIFGKGSSSLVKFGSTTHGGQNAYGASSSIFGIKLLLRAAHGCATQSTW